LTAACAIVRYAPPMRMGALAGVALVSLLSAGCGKEVGRVPFAAVGSADATVTASSGELIFWTDLDLEWEGEATLSYSVKVEQDGKEVGKSLCYPLAKAKVRTMWTETNVGSKHTRKGNARMECNVKLEKGGSTVIKTTLAFGDKPIKIDLRKADLVVKQ
jgi:hypothetical protein